MPARGLTRRTLAGATIIGVSMVAILIFVTIAADGGSPVELDRSHALEIGRAALEAPAPEWPGLQDARNPVTLLGTVAQLESRVGPIGPLDVTDRLSNDRVWLVQYEGFMPGLGTPAGQGDPVGYAAVYLKADTGRELLRWSGSVPLLTGDDGG